MLFYVIGGFVRDILVPLVLADYLICNASFFSGRNLWLVYIPGSV